METSPEILENETIQFVATKQDNKELIIEAIVPDNLSKKEKQEFNNNKATVKIMLYDNAFLDRVNSIPYPNEEEPPVPSVQRALSKIAAWILK